MMKFLFVGVFLFLSRSTRSFNVLVTPPVSQLVPDNSAENVTYLCNVTGGSSGVAVEAVWAVQGVQVADMAGRMVYAALGVFLTPGADGVTEMVVNSAARTLFGGALAVQCIGIILVSPPMTIDGQVLSIISYGPPAAPVALSLNPASSDNLNTLVFSWQPPGAELEGVNIEYHLTVTGLTINLANRTNLTSISIMDEAVSRDCRQHTFSVTASNDVGMGLTASINRTIPIVPDLTQLDEGFVVTAVSLTAPVRLSLIIPLATTCSEAFKILNYTLRSSEPALFPPLLLGNESSLGAQVTQVIPVPGLAQDVESDVFIEVCISITCKNSTTQPLRTSSTQNASLVYFENNIQMSCVLAADSDARGCRFILTVGNVSEMFDLLRGGRTTLTQCNQTDNQGQIYNTVSVVDIEANGENGRLALLLQANSLPDSSSYMQSTSCSIPSPPSALSAGAIVAIVLAGVVIGAALLVIVVLLITYRIKTGHWFKIQETDDHLTVHFEKQILISEGKQDKKNKPPKASTSPPGHNSPDLPLQGQMIVTAHSATSINESDIDVELAAGSSATAPASLAKTNRLSEHVDTPVGGAVVGGRDAHAQARSSATAPLLASPETQHAFTLDISSDRKKVKLHLNRPLIRQMLQEKKLDTMNRNKGHRVDRQVSYCKLPMTCEMRVRAPEDK